MGLTIHWNLKANIRTRAEALDLVGRFRQRALDLPFADVSDVLELSGGNADYRSQPVESPKRWLLIQSRALTESGGGGYSVTPHQVIAFAAEPGDGCEPANFGLCRYPAFIDVDDRTQKRRLKTGLSGWRWSSCCKTQYASNPECGGVQNFLKCHLLVIALLDFAQSLGIVESVTDEGNFWDTRDVAALAGEVGSWNESIAGFAGQLMDAFGADVVSNIAKFPNFEPLEAQGRRVTS